MAIPGESRIAAKPMQPSTGGHPRLLQHVVDCVASIPEQPHDGRPQSRCVRRYKARNAASSPARNRRIKTSSSTPTWGG